MNIDPSVIVNISLQRLCAVQSVRYLKSSERVLFVLFCFGFNIVVAPKGFSQDCSLLALQFSDVIVWKNTWSKGLSENNINSVL